MTKNVLVLVGSNNDIDKKGTPTKFTDDLVDTIEKINASNPGNELDYHLESCSADRTPDLLPFAINQKKFDGIIYHGGLSLVLGAAIQEALMKLRSEQQVEDTRAEREAMIRSGGITAQYVPGIHSPNRIIRTNSNYYKDFLPAVVTSEIRYIPTIGVPSTDSVSKGVTSLTSIVENPPGCEPRPTVGLGRIDTALTTMHHMLYGMQNGFDLITIAHEKETEKAAQELQSKLKEFGYLRTTLIPYTKIIDEDIKQRPEELIIFVGDTSYKAQLMTDMQLLDGNVDFMINCPAKKDMSQEWQTYLTTLTQLNHTISVGVGNYDNAAILAAQLLNRQEVNEKMWQYRNNKTLSGVINKPLWLKDGKVRRQ